MELMNLLRTMLIVQLFFGVSVTLIAHSVAMFDPSYVTYIDPFTGVHATNMANVTAQMQDSVQSQLNIPVVELGALLFYSGNIIIDMMLNFLFAIPEMITMFIKGIGLLGFGLNPFVMVQVQTFLTGLVVIMYLISLIELIVSIRAGSKIT